MSKINTNMAGVTTLYHLRNKEEGMNKSLERISSGLRLNHAVDDAAGASIVNRMTSQIKGLEAAIRNAADAISLTQTAEGAIEEVTQILHRMRELSVQSANGVYTGQDRQAIQNEVGALQEELHRIAESSTFNGVKMLNGSFLDTTFQVGFQPNDTATLSIEDVKPTGLGEYILKTSVTNAENYLIDETSPMVAGTETAHIANNGSAVSIDLFENSVVSIHTINQTVSGNDVTGISTNNLKSFVEADTGTTGAFTLEVGTGQTGSDTDASKFNINASTGEITLSSGVTALDFEDNASAAGNNDYVFNVVYTNSDGVKFSEQVTLSLKNKLNTTGSSAISVKTETADNSPTTVVDIKDLSPDLLFRAKELGMQENEDGTLNSDNFTGSFVIVGAPAGGGVTIDSSNGGVNLRTANNLPAAQKLDTTSPQTFQIRLRNADNEQVYLESVTLNVTDASGEFATTDGLDISTPGNIVSRANTTNISLNTNTATSTPATIIEESDLLRPSVVASTLGFDSQTDFTITATTAGVTLFDHGDGSFDINIDTDNNATHLTVGASTLTIEAYDTTPNSVTAGPAASATASSGTSTGVVTTNETSGAAFTFTQSDVSDTSFVTALSGVSSTNATVRIVPSVVGVTITNTSGAFNFEVTIDRDTSGSINAPSQTITLEYFDSSATGTPTIYTETVNLTVNEFVQHTFTVNLAATDGTGQGALNGEASVTSKTSNDNAIASNLVTGGTVTTTSTSVTSDITLRTNQPTGSLAFTFDETDSNFATASVVSSVSASNLRFSLGSSTPDGITIVDNLDGTFDVTMDVDNSGEFVPVDATSFSIEIEDNTNPGVTIFTETFNLNMIDMKGNVVKTAGNERTTGEISIAMSAVEGAAAKVPPERFSSALSSFVEDNANGTFSLSGTDAELFRINEQTGEVTSRTFIDHENPTDDGAGNQYDFNIIYTAGENTFTDKVSLSITNDERDDVVTQAAGKPLVGRSAIDAASLVSEEEDFIIYGNVGNATIDVNGGASAYDLVQAINARQGETGVYAAAQTRVNLSFPDQFDPVSDAVSFKLQGVNDEPVLVSGSVDFGVENGRDANLRNLADAINGVSGKTGITAKVSTNGAMIHMFSNDGHDIVVENFTLSVLNIPMQVSATNDELESIGEMQLLRKGTDEMDTFRSTGEITFHSPYVFSVETSRTGIDGGGIFQLTPGAADLVSVSELDVLTVENAKKMLTAVDAALVRIDLERSDLGATMSRMEHTINNLSNIVVNTKAARSRIQDADIAEETTNMTKAQVLSQAAQAMLAQANRTSQSILSLLQG